MTSKTEKIIIKFLNNQVSASEIDSLAIWIQDPHNEKIFNAFIKTNYAIDFNMKQFDATKVKNKLLEMMENERKVIKFKKSRQIISYAAAAILVIAMASTYILRNSIFNGHIENITPIVVSNQIEPGIDKATLTLETGEKVALEIGTSFQTQNASSNGEVIKYNNITSSKLAYNYLTIPRGAQFQLTLSDGTRVWLNSETQLKYPVGFIDGESRQVELIYGEAYFEVSPSTEHKGSDFKVYNIQQEVQVLGTEFNIKAYKDETNIYTTLVEGKVAISTSKTKQILAPNQQSILNTKTHNLSTSNIDVKGEVAWVNGEFILKNKNLAEIMKVLSRWYDMEVTFANKDLENERFIGVLGKEQDIVEILNTIKSFGVIKSYEINNKKVLLK